MKGNFSTHLNLKKPIIIGCDENISIIKRPTATRDIKQSKDTSLIPSVAVFYMMLKKNIIPI